MLWKAPVTVSGSSSRFWVGAAVRHTLTLTLLASAVPQRPQKFSAVTVAVQSPEVTTPADPFPESRPLVEQRRGQAGGPARRPSRGWKRQSPTARSTRSPGAGRAASRPRSSRATAGPARPWLPIASWPVARPRVPERSCWAQTSDSPSAAW